MSHPGALDVFAPFGPKETAARFLERVGSAMRAGEGQVLESADRIEFTDITLEGAWAPEALIRPNSGFVAVLPTWSHVLVTYDLTFANRWWVMAAPAIALELAFLALGGARGFGCLLGAGAVLGAAYQTRHAARRRFATWLEETCRSALAQETAVGSLR